MPEILHHDLPLQASRLGNELEAVLASLPAGSPPFLAVDLAQRTTPLLVFTGAYSTGKSALISALTDNPDIVIAADRATDEVREYDWNGVVVLVDTPGMHAGLATHDELAESALRRADLIVFTVSVELFDDDATTQLRHILDDLGKRPQTLIAITKAGSMAAAPGVREQAVRQAVGGDDVPFVECDAEFYRESWTEPDSELRLRLIEASNIHGVGRLIDAMAARRGQLALHRQPFQQIRAIAEEVRATLADEPGEQAMLTILARQRNSLTAHEGRISSLAQAECARFLVDCQVAAEMLADEVEAADTIDETADSGMRKKAIADAEQRLRDSTSAALDGLQGGLNRLVALQLSDLAAEAAEIDEDDRADYVRSMTAPAVDLAARPEAPAFRAAAHRRAPAEGVPLWLPDAQKILKDFVDFWGAGEGTKKSAGTLGHKIVLDLGHRLGHKFKPWGAAKLADGIGKAGRVAGVAIPVIVDVADMAMRERARRQLEDARFGRRRQIVSGVMTQAKDIADQAVLLVQREIRDQFARAYAEVDAMRDEILTGRAQRSAADVELARIIGECELNLDRIASVEAIEELGFGDGDGDGQREDWR